MSGTTTSEPRPRGLVRATDIDVLPADREVERRGDHLVVRSPDNPAHWWGNFLIFDDAPRAGDGERWERAFADAFGADPRIRHSAFAWDRTDGARGAAGTEFVARGYELEQVVGLAATPDELRPHPRANRDVLVRPLDPDSDAELWEQVVAIQVASAGREPRDVHEAFTRRRQEELRVLFRAGRGAWYVALLPGGTEVAGSCGIVVTGPRGRYQTVDTAEPHRRRGICSRLVVEAADHAVRRFGAERLVIAAELEYHALGLYESLGFVARERACGVLRPAPA